MPLKKLKKIAKKYDGRVAKLLSIGRDELMRVERYSYVKKFGFTQDDVPQLLELAQDMEIYNYDYDDIPEDEGLEFFGVIHAWHVLSELEVEEAKEMFIEKMATYSEDEYDDWILSDFRRLMKPFRKDMYDLSVEIAQNEKYGTWTRLEYIGLVEDMFKAKEIELSMLNEMIVNILSSSDNGIVNASVISICMDQKLVEHHELIQKCFQRSAVDIMYNGDLEDVEIRMGLREERETQKEPTEIQKMFQRMMDTIDEDESYLSSNESKSKIGRNDPCPCGSGKKYKKCCLKRRSTI